MFLELKRIKLMNKRYSSLQVFEYTKGSYRVKDYQFNSWIYVIRKNGEWIFNGMNFRTANDLNKYLKEEKICLN